MDAALIKRDPAPNGKGARLELHALANAHRDYFDLLLVYRRKGQKLAEALQDPATLGLRIPKVLPTMLSAGESDPVKPGEDAWVFGEPLTPNRLVALIEVAWQCTVMLSSQPLYVSAVYSRGHAGLVRTHWKPARAPQTLEEVN